MVIYALGELTPDIHPDAFVHPDAVVIGAVRIGAGASIWPTAVLRADYGRIEIGGLTSIQDGTIVHTTADWPTIVGSRCVVGHNAHLEGCRIHDDCLIGSGSVVLNRVVIESGAAVGAGALVPGDAVVPSGHIALGIPARSRPAPALADWIAGAVGDYRDLAKRYRTELRRIG